jgi:hypothetical protein
MGSIGQSDANDYHLPAELAVLRDPLLEELFPEVI